MDSDQIADAALRQPDRLRALEHRAIADATRPLAQAITSAQTEAVTRWIRETAGTRIPTRLGEFIDWVRDLIRRAFASKGRQAQLAAERHAFTAAHDSVQSASRLTTAMTGQSAPELTAEPGPDAQAAADAIPAAVQEEQGHALALLTAAGLTATGLAGLNAAFTRACRAVGRIALGTAVAVGAAAAHGALLVARALGPGVRLLWVSEPDACPACLAYAGRHIRPGGRFPGGLSLDPRRAVFAAAIPGPPRHPHCRCVLLPWSPNWPLAGTPLPTILRRRARAHWRPA